MNDQLIKLTAQIILKLKYKYDLSDADTEELREVFMLIYRKAEINALTSTEAPSFENFMNQVKGENHDK